MNFFQLALNSFPYRETTRLRTLKVELQRRK
jgi:hypothetical protein